MVFMMTKKTWRFIMPNKVDQYLTRLDLLLSNFLTDSQYVQKQMKSIIKYIKENFIPSWGDCDVDFYWGRDNCIYIKHHIDRNTYLILEHDYSSSGFNSYYIQPRMPIQKIQLRNDQVLNHVRNVYQKNLPDLIASRELFSKELILKIRKIYELPELITRSEILKVLKIHHINIVDDHEKKKKLLKEARLYNISNVVFVLDDISDDFLWQITQILGNYFLFPEDVHFEIFENQPPKQMQIINYFVKELLLSEELIRKYWKPSYKKNIRRLSEKFDIEYEIFKDRLKELSII